MKRFFAKIARFFWSWGFLWFILTVIVLIVLLYVEEDWRGAHAWAATKAEWEAKDESFDPKTYYPPSIPDDQNLAALPVFQLEPDKKGRLTPLRLDDALDEYKHGGNLPPFLEKDKLSAAVAQAYAKLFKGKTPPATASAQLEELYPIIGEVRSAALSRPKFRLNEDYALTPTWNRGLGLTVGQIRLAKLLTLHAFLLLRENRPDVALSDIKIGFQIAQGVGKNPSLVAGLVSCGIVAKHHLGR